MTRREWLLIALFCFLAGTVAVGDSITDLTGYTGQVGQEDINYGTGLSTDTFTVPTYDGSTVTLTKVPDPTTDAHSRIKGVWYVNSSTTIADHGAASGADYAAGNLKKIIDLTGHAITAATKANPVVISAADHGFANGDTITILDVVGMTQLNGNEYIVANKTTGTFELSGVDGSAYGTYSSGGYAHGDGVTIDLPANADYPVLTNMVVPRNVGVRTNPGAIVEATSGTVAWKGPVIGDPTFQWLSGSGHSFASTFVSRLLTQWWGATGNGIIADTAAIQNTFTASYSSKIPVFFPLGSYLTGTIIYYGQSMYGVPGSGNPLFSAGRSRIIGLDTEDVFQFPDITSATQGYVRGTLVKDLTIIVDDTSDATGSFSRDGGAVGNCAFALPAANGTAAGHTFGNNPLIHGKFENVSLESLSQTAQNGSCGIFQQALIIDFIFDHLHLQRLEFGFWGTKPTTNDHLIEYAPDWLQFLGVNFNGCINPFRVYNSFQSIIDGMLVLGSSSGDKGIRIEQYSSLARDLTILWSITGLYEELNAATTGEISKYEGHNHVITASTLKQNYGASYITWDAIGSKVTGSRINGVTGGASATLRFSSTSRNNLFDQITTREPDGAWLSDAGNGNIVKTVRYDAEAMRSSRPISEMISRFQPALVRTGDFTITGPSSPYFSQEDLFITPSDMDLTGVSETITKDTTIIESGEYITFPSPGSAGFFDSNSTPSLLGYRFPESKIRVYIKAKMASSATTQPWDIRVDNVVKGSDSLSFGTTFSVEWFDADFTGLTKGDSIRFFAGDAVVAQDVHVAWVAVVPHKEYDLNAHIGTSWGVYDFAVDTGATGNYRLGQIFNNAVITRAWYETITDPTSDGAATIAISTAQAANEIITATAFDNAIFDPGYHDGTPDGTATNFTTQTTDIRDVQLVIAGAALTAGKIKVWWEYVVGE
ncbi:hypothetical protein LCGC14_0384130 [marine sediment metagenome]|uniref:Ubiquitin-activating enzyme E1 FCCH domain-containing protein n=1 Tax=marine sediment metagenome TaxID=412755 RepID=A0A0F9T745_9ZZZZ